MKTDVFLRAILFFVAAVVQAQKMLEDTVKRDEPSESIPSPSPNLKPWKEVSISYDQVKPFTQRKPETASDKASVKFKPSFSTYDGCQPYPAANEVGETSGGLEPKGTTNAGCMGSALGSQVYGRSTWHGEKWAIVYAWYMAKDMMPFIFGQRHLWTYVIVWIDNPAVEKPNIVGVSLGDGLRARKTRKVPSDDELKDGVGVKVKHLWDGVHNGRMLEFTTEDGKEQDLVTWDQLSANARQAFNEVYWGKQKMPLSDDEFKNNLELAWPTKQTK